MNPADELRAAAKLLRETASKATPAAKWQLLSYQIVGLYDEAADTVTDVAFTYGNQPNARWIALASPAIAEPLAAWLERAGDDLSGAEAYLARTPGEIFDPFEYCDEPDSVRAALAVARAINGGDRA